MSENSRPIAELRELKALLIKIIEDIDREIGRFEGIDPETIQKARQIPLTNLGLSRKTYLRLIRDLGAETAADIITKTPREIYLLQQVGASTLKEIQTKLQEHGLSLRIPNEKMVLPKDVCEALGLDY